MDSFHDNLHNIGSFLTGLINISNVLKDGMSIIYILDYKIQIQI